MKGMAGMPPTVVRRPTQRIQLHIVRIAVWYSVYTEYTEYTEYDTVSG